MACYQNLLGIFPNFFDFKLNCEPTNEPRKATRHGVCLSVPLALSLPALSPLWGAANTRQEGKARGGLSHVKSVLDYVLLL